MSRRAFLVRSLASVTLFGRARIRPAPVPLSVSYGLVTLEEFHGFSSGDRQLAEHTTGRLMARYGSAWMRRERLRLRAELLLFAA